MTQDTEADLGTFSLPELDASGEDPTAISTEGVGRYTFEMGDRDRAEVARGGIGRILVAMDQHLGRQIAIKELLLQDSAEKAAISKGDRPRKSATIRFLREARVTGQLEHPNIVPVYELGQRPDGTLYYAMKLVRGQTLASLLKKYKSLAERQRLLPHMISLCNAIAYAHSRHVIHRDIKPANVMLGEFGETLVLDWGLAKVAGQKDLSEDELEHELKLLDADKDETQAGTAIGTPAYMSPEQAQGRIEAIDYSSDVWSLGAVLYELLTGQAPFHGKTAHEVIDQVKSGQAITPPRQLDRNIPSALAAICDKALSREKAERYSSAREMAKDLEAFGSGLQVAAHSYGLAEKIWLLIKQHKVAVSVSCMVMLLLGLLGQQYYINLKVQKCAGAESRLESVWGQAKKTALRAAFVASSSHAGADTYTKVARLLDRYATAWTSHHTQACEATHKHGTQSERLLDLRMRCLDRQLGQMQAMVSVFSDKPDKSVVARSVEGASKVFAPARLDSCADSQALSAAFPPPSDPDKRESLDRTNRLVDLSQALEKAGRFKAGLAKVEEALGQAQKLDHPPLEARALRQTAYLKNSLGKYEEAASLYRQAALEAARARDDSLLARVRIEELRNSGYNLSRKKELPTLEHNARTALARVDDQALLTAELENSMFAIQHLAGEYKKAEMTARKVLAILERVNGRNHPRTADALNNLGLVQINLDQGDKALEYLGQAQATYEKTLGPQHPYVAYALYNIATIHFERLDHPKALAAYRKTLSIFEKAYGSDSPNVGQTLGTIGSLLTKMNKLDEAEQTLKRALAIQTKSIGPKHPYTLLLKSYGCNLKLKRKSYPEARDCFTAVLEEYGEAVKEEHEDVITAQLELAQAYAHLKLPVQVERYANKAIASRKKALGAKHPKVGLAVLSFGKSMYILGRYERAQKELSLALELLRDKKDHYKELADTMFSLARVYYELGLPQAEYMDLVRNSQKYCASPKSDPELCQQITNWIKENPPSPATP